MVSFFVHLHLFPPAKRLKCSCKHLQTYIYIYIKKKDWVSAGSTRFRRANFQAGFYLDPDWSQPRVGWVPGRPAESVQVSKL